MILKVTPSSCREVLRPLLNFSDKSWMLGSSRVVLKQTVDLVNIIHPTSRQTKTPWSTLPTEGWFLCYKQQQFSAIIFVQLKCFKFPFELGGFFEEIAWRNADPSRSSLTTTSSRFWLPHAINDFYSPPVRTEKSDEHSTEYLNPS